MAGCSTGGGGCCRPKDTQVKVFVDCFHFLTLDCLGGGRKKVGAEHEDFDLRGLIPYLHSVAYWKTMSIIACSS